MSEKKTIDDVTVAFGRSNPFRVTGTLVFQVGTSAMTGRLANLLELWDDEGPSRLSIQLGAYGIHDREGHCWIKDWSEGEGVTDSLVANGLVEKVRTVTVGPFDSPAHEVKILF